MNYFEIGGELIELATTYNDVDYGLGNQKAVEHREKKMFLKELRKGLDSIEEVVEEETTDRDNIAIHAIKMWTHPIRSFAEESGKRKITLLKNPHLFALWSFHRGLEEISLNYDYFVKGESHGW